MLLQVQGELALQDKLISTLWTDQILQARRGQTRGVRLSGWTSTAGFMLGRLVTNLLLLVQHDMRFEAGDAGESFIADRAGKVGCFVRGLVECEVELHVKRLRAMVTSVRLPRTEDTLTFTWSVLIYRQITRYLRRTPQNSELTERIITTKKPAAPQISINLQQPQWLCKISFGPDRCRTLCGVWFWRAETRLTRYSRDQLL